MKNQLNKLKNFLGFSVKLPVTSTSSTLFIAGLVLSSSLFTAPSKSFAQIIIERDEYNLQKAPSGIYLSTNLFTYCQDLASWKNNPPSGKIRSLGITIVTNNSDGLGRLYRGSVEGRITNFLGRPTELLISSSGNTSTNKGRVTFGYAFISSNLDSYQSGFNWVCGTNPELASIRINYPAYTALGNVYPAESESFNVRNIRIVDNLLYGEVEESDASQ